MKFEIDPNELTSEQRTHIVAFITNWPVNAVRQERIDQLKALATSVRMEQPTEEQRLDAEQKRDFSGIKEIRESGSVTAVNLNAIFGAPTPLNSQTLERVPSVPLDKEGLPWDSRIHASTKTFIADGTWKLRRGVDPAEVEKVKAQLKELMAVPVDGSVYAGILPIPPEGVEEFKDELKEYLGSIPVPTVRNVAHEELVKVLSEGKTEIPTPPHVTIGVDMASGSDTTVITPIAPAPVLTPTDVGYVPVPPTPKSHYLIDQHPEVVDIPLVRPPATVTLTDLIARMSAAIVAGKMTQATVAEMCAKHGVSEFMLLSSRPDLLPLIDADMKAMGV